jgi:hypothetical protein
VQAFAAKDQLNHGDIEPPDFTQSRGMPDSVHLSAQVAQPVCVVHVLTCPKGQRALDGPLDAR